jgi:hypothetical protein
MQERPFSSISIQRNTLRENYVPFDEPTWDPKLGPETPLTKRCHVRWVDDAEVAVLRQKCIKTSGHTFSGIRNHAPKKVCHNGGFTARLTHGRVDETMLYLLS